jgi:hypothetical protein
VRELRVAFIGFIRADPWQSEGRVTAVGFVVRLLRRAFPAAEGCSSRHWSDQHLDSLHSPEALTAAVQRRYLIEERLKRDLARASSGGGALAA